MKKHQTQPSLVPSKKQSEALSMNKTKQIWKPTLPQISEISKQPSEHTQKRKNSEHNNDHHRGQNQSSHNYYGNKFNSSQSPKHNSSSHEEPVDPKDKGISPHLKENQEPSASSAEQKPQKYRQSFLNKSSTQAHRYSIEQRNQITNFRIKRDIWIRDLQDVFNKIYDNFVLTLDTIKEDGGRKKSKAEKIAFCKRLRAQMREIQKISNSLSDRNDEFIHLQDNMPITHYYKSNIMEMHRLLQILLKLQLDTRHLDKIQTKKKYDNQCAQPLSDEIKRSYRRVQRLKAGNKLGKVIQDQLEISEGQEKMEQQQQSQQIQFVSSLPNDRQKQQIFEAGLSPSKVIEKQNNNNNTDKNITLGTVNNNDFSNLEDYLSQNPMEEQIRKNDRNTFTEHFEMQSALENFKQKKGDLEILIQSFVDSFNKQDFNFNEKYKHFKEYFSKRYELMGIYFGESKLNNFLSENERKASPQRKTTSREQEKIYLENNYKDLDPANFSVDDKNIEALQRIIKINEEIRRNLIEEEHAQKMKALDKMNVEQNQQFWAAAFEKKEQAGQQTPASNGNARQAQGGKESSRNALASAGDGKQHHQIKKGRSSGGLREPFQVFSKETLSNKPEAFNEEQQIRRYHDYLHRNVNYDSHPSNPHLKPVVEYKFQPEKIKFASVSESNAVHIVSSITSLRKQTQLKEKLFQERSIKTQEEQEEFRKTFLQNTMLSHTSKSSCQNPEELVIKYPQINKLSSYDCIFPKQKEKLSYEEEKRLIDSQTKSETPLYLNKFNATNYFSRVSASKNKDKESFYQDNNNDNTATTTISTTNQNNNSSTNAKTLLALSGQIPQGFDILAEKQKRGKSQQQNNMISIQENVQKGSYFDFNNVKDSTNNQSSAGGQAQPKDLIIPKRKDIMKDEISTLFRMSQTDVLFRINGPSWKNK